MNAPTLTAAADPEAAAAALIPDLAGRVVTPADPDWDTARQAWNLAVDQRPALVAQVDDAADIVAVVTYARSAGLRVAPQGTGHNASPLGDLSGAVLLRTDRLREVSVDSDRLIVRVGAGVLWGEVTEALAPYGLTARAGSSPDVGVVGYTLGGGYSWLSRKHGLAVSAVTAVELVTGDGVFHRVDAETEPELFWAVRGGGANIGIVSALEFGVLPFDRVFAGSLFFPIDRAAEVLRAHARWTATVDEAATTCVRLLRLPPLPELPEPLRGNAFAVIDGAIDAPVEQAEEMLTALRGLGPVIDTFADLPTAALGMIHMDPPNPVPGIGDGVLLDELTDDTIDSLLTIAGPGADTALLAVDLRHLGGAAGRPASGGGAVDQLPGRYLAFAVGIAAGPQVAAQVAADVQAFRAALAPWSADRDYLNFREHSAPAGRFFAPQTLARLLAVAEQVDPDRVLQANHPVR